MILIIGGFCQGKTAYLKQLPEYHRLSSGGCAVEVADGTMDTPEDAYRRPVILNFHQYIKRLGDETRVWEVLDRILTENPDALITMDEVGYGIVPVTPKERAYRELAGLAGQRLAKEASQVYRVVCGIGMRIKP